MRNLVFGTAMLFVLAAGAAMVTAQVPEDEVPVPERFVGRVVALSGPVGGQTAFCTLHVDRYSEIEVGQALAQTLADGGQKALLKAIQDIEPVGWIKVGNGLSYHLRVIRSLPAEGGGRVIMGVTDRPIQMAEMARNWRSRSYTIGVVTLQVDEKGVGSGNLIPAAEVRFNNDGVLEIESFGLQPYRILSIKPEKVKSKKAS